MTSVDMISTDYYLQQIYGEETLTKRELLISCSLLAPESIWEKGCSTVDELEALTGYCNKSVSRIVASLENKGFMRRTHEKSPDNAKTVTVFHLSFPGRQPGTTELLSGNEREDLSDDPAETKLLSDNEGEVLSSAPTETELLSDNEGEVLSDDPAGTKLLPGNRQLSSSELKDLEPEDLEPEDLEPQDPEPEDLEPEDLDPEDLEPEGPEPEGPEPEDLEPENQDQGQNQNRPDNATHLRIPRKPSEDLPRKVLELYRLLCSDLPPAGRISAKRAHAVQVLADICPPAQSPGWWETYFTRVAQSSFLTGSGSRGWQADLDWLLVPSNADKVLGGNYDDHSPSRPRDGDESLEDYVDRMVDFMDRTPLP